MGGGAPPLGIYRSSGEGEGHRSPQDDGQGSDDTPQGAPSTNYIYSYRGPPILYIYLYIHLILSMGGRPPRTM